METRETTIQLDEAQWAQVFQGKSPLAAITRLIPHLPINKQTLQFKGDAKYKASEEIILSFVVTPELLDALDLVLSKLHENQSCAVISFLVQVVQTFVPVCSMEDLGATLPLNRLAICLHSMSLGPTIREVMFTKRASVSPAHTVVVLQFKAGKLSRAVFR